MVALAMSALKKKPKRVSYDLEDKKYSAKITPIFCEYFNCGVKEVGLKEFSVEVTQETQCGSTVQ